MRLFARRLRTDFSGDELLVSPLARAIAIAYKFAPLRLRVLLIAVVWWLEGGHVRSATTRRLLERYHGVVVGAHTYGALLVPGMAEPGTVIGRYVSIGPNVRRYGANHPMSGMSLHAYWYDPVLKFVDHYSAERSELVICDDAWIGANVVILPGCTRIGVGAAVGAGAVLTKDVDDFSVVVGVPATERAKRLTPELRRALLVAHPWSLPPRECRQLLDEIDRSAH